MKTTGFLARFAMEPQKKYLVVKPINLHTKQVFSGEDRQWVLWSNSCCFPR